MKIALQLLNSFKPGGAENVALNYAFVLRKLGIESVFIAKDNDYTYKERILSLGFQVSSSISRRLLKDSSYIFIHSNINLLKLTYHYVFLKRHKNKIFYIQHLRYSKIKFRILAKVINCICTDFIQITPITSSLIRKHIQIQSHFIVNFYPNKYLQNEYSNIRYQVKTEYSIPLENRIVMFSGVLKSGKGLCDFLELAKSFIIDTSVTFLIVGDGSEHYLIDNYNLKNVICTGFVNDVEKFLICSDIYIFASKVEMMPMALIEAINTDRKILAYDTIVNRYLLKNEVFTTLEDMVTVIKSNKVPYGFVHYDEKYALERIADIL